MKHTFFAASAIAVAIVCAAPGVLAQKSKSAVNPYGGEGEYAFVVMVTDKEIVFDAGTRAGVEAGDRVRLYRTLTVHHPVTGQQITDKFPIGTVRVAEASELLSIIKQTKALKHPAKVGDLVLLPQPETEKKPAPTATPSEAPAPKPTPPKPAGADGDKRALGAAFTATLGKSLVVRLGQYRAFLEAYPDSVYAKAVTREVAWLESIQQKLAAEAAGPCPGEPATPSAVNVLHAEIGQLEVGDEVQAVIAVLPPKAARGARLYVRKVGEEGYEQVQMVRDGSYYYRADFPAELLAETGRLAYFIEIAGADGKPRPVVGAEGRPREVEVKLPIVDEIARKGRSTLTTIFEYVNFDLDDKVDDEYWSFEADFFYRINTFLYGVRVGMGVFSGTGGELKQIEASPENNQQLAAHYGFLEGEFEIVSLFHIMLRGLAGNQRAPGSTDERMSEVFGFEGGVRIGEELRTNLVASGAIVQNVGYQGRLALSINVFRKVPIIVEGLVTNFPVDDSHVGLRLVVGTGYRFTDWLAILARGSWNARTITHTGFGGGASLALSW